MAKKHKTFDCVEMKEQIQKKLLSEYEARKGEFASYEDFIHFVCARSPWVRRMKRRVAAARNRPVPPRPVLH